MELFINRRTAKALGITIPQSLVISADKVIQYTVTACERPVCGELAATPIEAPLLLAGPQFEDGLIAHSHTQPFETIPNN